MTVYVEWSGHPSYWRAIVENKAGRRARDIPWVRTPLSPTTPLNKAASVVGSHCDFLRKFSLENHSVINVKNEFKSQILILKVR